MNQYQTKPTSATAFQILPQNFKAIEKELGINVGIFPAEYVCLSGDDFFAFADLSDWIVKTDVIKIMGNAEFRGIYDLK